MGLSFFLKKILNNKKSEVILLLWVEGGGKTKSMNNNKIISDKALEQLKRVGKRFSTLIIAIVLLLVLGTLGFQIATKYIWMDSLDFSKVYTTILYSKATLGISGFVLFFILSFVTLY